MPRVFVSGCFDLLHSGHIAFLEEAAGYGDLHVGIGSDDTVYRLKGRWPINNQDERRYMLRALRCVSDVLINSGDGILDFEAELETVRPDTFVVNEDGHSEEKRRLIEAKGIAYLVLKRVPYANLPPRSTTDLRTITTMPYRIDLAGGWLDQPFVAKHHPGPVLTISIEATHDFSTRSGMATSTRAKAIQLWRTGIPPGDPEHLAAVLFSFDNPPGTVEFSGSQDALGIVMPGLNRLHYSGSYWPDNVESVHDESILSWLETRLHLVSLGPRTRDYDVLAHTYINEEGARRLSEAAERCWEAILDKDTAAFGEAFRASFEAQVAMFPHMFNDGVQRLINRHAHEAFGWKLSGAGGGGYVILVSETPVSDAIQIRIRRSGM